MIDESGENRHGGGRIDLQVRPETAVVSRLRSVFPAVEVMLVEAPGILFYQHHGPQIVAQEIRIQGQAPGRPASVCSAPGVGSEQAGACRLGVPVDAGVVPGIVCHKIEVRAGTQKWQDPGAIILVCVKGGTENGFPVRYRREIELQITASDGVRKEVRGFAVIAHGENHVDRGIRHRRERVGGRAARKTERTE